MTSKCYYITSCHVSQAKNRIVKMYLKKQKVYRVTDSEKIILSFCSALMFSLNFVVESLTCLSYVLAEMASFKLIPLTLCS